MNLYFIPGIVMICQHAQRGISPCHVKTVFACAYDAVYILGDARPFGKAWAAKEASIGIYARLKVYCRYPGLLPLELECDAELWARPGSGQRRDPRKGLLGTSLNFVDPVADQSRLHNCLAQHVGIKGRDEEGGRTALRRQ